MTGSEIFNVKKIKTESRNTLGVLNTANYLRMHFCCGCGRWSNDDPINHLISFSFGVLVEWLCGLKSTEVWFFILNLLCLNFNAVSLSFFLSAIHKTFAQERRLKIVYMTVSTRTYADTHVATTKPIGCALGGLLLRCSVVAAKLICCDAGKRFHTWTKLNAALWKY